MKKKPMPKGNSLAANKTAAKPSPIGKTQLPAARHGMPKSTKVSRGKAGALY